MRKIYKHNYLFLSFLSGLLSFLSLFLLCIHLLLFLCSKTFNKTHYKKDSWWRRLHIDSYIVILFSFIFLYIYELASSSNCNNSSVKTKLPLLYRRKQSSPLIKLEAVFHLDNTGKKSICLV